jgi:polyisoprenyl-teichoic acid--peptidoglycan teichoic acid transferase
MSSRSTSTRAFFGRFLIALVVGSLLMAGVVAGVDREIAHKVDRIPKIPLTTPELPPEGANYLLVGVDNLGETDCDPLSRDAFGCREDEKNTDTIMVVHLEPRAERVIVVSFPRDLLVNIPGHGQNKINAAYSFGDTPRERAQSLIDTVSQNFGIEIHHFVELNFLSFVGLVNTLGDVSVYVPYAAYDEKTGFWVPRGGCYPLDGEKSLQYVRSRYLGYWDERIEKFVSVNDRAPDLSRINRQQEFMRKLAGLAVAKSLDNPFTADKVADQIVKNLVVDDAFDKGSIFELLDAFRTLNPDDTSALVFETMPSRSGTEVINGQGLAVQYWLRDQGGSQLVRRLNTFDQRPRPTPAPSTIRIRIVNASGREDLGVAVKRVLEELGFVVTEQVEAAVIRQEGSSIAYASGQIDKAKLLQRYVEPVPNIQLGDSNVLGADIEVTLGRNFRAIAVPADALVTTTTTVSPDQVTEEGVLDTPVVVPPSPDDLVLPNPAPRGDC